MKGFCNQPFRNIYLNDGSVSPCCYAKKTLHIKTRTSEYLPERIWLGRYYNEFREAIRDKTYKYCSESCPYIQNMQSGQSHQYFDSFACANKQEFDFVSNRGNSFTGKPVYIQNQMDCSCNYKCLSCRDNWKRCSPEKAEQYSDIFLKWLEYSAENLIIMLGGCGEPFLAKDVLDFICCADIQNTSAISLKVAEIKVITNGSLLTKKMLDSIAPPVKKKMSEWNISLDASSKDVYQTIRIGGSWNTVLNNIHILKREIPDAVLKLHFIIQKDNFKDIPGFFELARRFSAIACFPRIQEFPEMAYEEKFVDIDVCSRHSRYHKEFLQVIDSLSSKDRQYLVNAGVVRSSGILSRSVKEQKLQ